MIAESQPGHGNEARPFYDFLESCLRHKSEIVIFEAARAICNMRCARRGGGAERVPCCVHVAASEVQGASMFRPEFQEAGKVLKLRLSIAAQCTCPTSCTDQLLSTPPRPQQGCDHPGAHSRGDGAAAVPLLLQACAALCRRAHAEQGGRQAVRIARQWLVQGPTLVSTSSLPACTSHPCATRAFLPQVAMSHPMAVTNCNIDMESLIADPNRSIATLVREVGGCAAQLQDVDVQLVHRRHPAAHKEVSAHHRTGHLPTFCNPPPPHPTPPHPRQAITTLLKTGNESSIDRLLKQIGGFMSEVR